MGGKQRGWGENPFQGGRLASRCLIGGDPHSATAASFWASSRLPSGSGHRPLAQGSGREGAAETGWPSTPTSSPQGGPPTAESHCGFLRGARPPCPDPGAPPIATPGAAGTLTIWWWWL